MADDVEQSVAQHYTHGSLERAILDALTQSRKDPDRLTPQDLTPVDEFHIGGRQATAEVAVQLGVAPGAHLLHIGSGRGGASRYFANDDAPRVSGIGLAEKYGRAA